MGYEEIDCIVIDIDKNKEKALNIALNKITGEDTGRGFPGAGPQNGEPESFYADGIEYYIIANNMGYDGDIRKIQHVLYNCSASRRRLRVRPMRRARQFTQEDMDMDRF